MNCMKDKAPKMFTTTERSPAWDKCHAEWEDGKKTIKDQLENAYQEYKWFDQTEDEGTNFVPKRKEFEDRQARKQEATE